MAEKYKSHHAKSNLADDTFQCQICLVHLYYGSRPLPFSELMILFSQV